MAQTQRLRPNARARAAALREKEGKREARRRLLTAVAAVVSVVAVIAVLVGIRLASGNDKSSSSEGGASTLDPAIASKVTSVPAATLNSIGAGTVKTFPKKISGSPLVYGSKPKVVYVGAEYCPFCAVERWPMVVALSRFGTWKNLAATTSAASPEVFPNTPTFSFHGASYSSPYVAFDGVETNTNKSTGSGYVPLDKMSAEQKQLMSKYNPGGTIPFIDFGNRYAIDGASYAPEVLQGKSMAQIADALDDPNSAIAKGVGGTANAMTATICQLTNNAPSNVCSSPAVTAVRGNLAS